MNFSRALHLEFLNALSDKDFFNSLLAKKVSERMADSSDLSCRAPLKRIRRREIVMAQKNLRIMVAKPGLDGHDRGARILARSFRDAGYEVIYTGCHQTPEQIVEAALQEDVDLIGLSCLSGAHKHLFPKVVQQLEQRGGGDIPVIGGGIIPEKDINYLHEQGIKEVFTPGTPLEEIIGWIEKNVESKEAL